MTDFAKLKKSYDLVGYDGYEETSAIRNVIDCPPLDAQDGDLWPLRPTVTSAVLVWLKEIWLELIGRNSEKTAFWETRTLWRRHPWQKVGDVWWRPFWGQGMPVKTGTFETIDPESGLHVWAREYDEYVTPFFCAENYYCAVLRRSL